MYYEVPIGIFLFVASEKLEFFCDLRGITGGLRDIDKNFEDVGGYVICFFLRFRKITNIASIS